MSSDSGRNARTQVRTRGRGSAERTIRRGARAVLTHDHPTSISTTRDAIVLKSGNLFMLTTREGDIPAALPHPFGVYREDCRHLNRLALTINGEPPTLLSPRAASGFRAQHFLSNPQLQRLGGHTAIDKHEIEIVRDRVIVEDAIQEHLRVQYRGREPVRLRLELRFGAGFEDVFVVKGFHEDSEGSPLTSSVGDTWVTLRRRGRDEVARATTLVFAPAPDRLNEEVARWDLSFAAGSERMIAIAITASTNEDIAPRRPDSDPETAHARAEDAASLWRDRWPTVASGTVFDRVFHQSVADLQTLRSRIDGYEYFAAGVPWFATLFGRDAIVTMLQTVAYERQSVSQTLQLLARYQATETDADRDAEPGKIVHEYRAGELAHRDAIPQSPAYYGSVDAPMLFVIAVADYVAWSGDLELARRLRPHVDAALGWMARNADSGGGYVHYSGWENGRPVNQGWKDSGAAIVNADGSFAEPPIALCEAQAYAFRAWREGAALFHCLGDDAAAMLLARRAAELRTRFEHDYWDPALGCYVLARQSAGRPAAVVSSNTGQVLWGGLADPRRASAIADRLLRSDMYSGWGVRTLSTEALAYNPVSYNAGTVWPHDNSLIIAGLRRYGEDEAALRIFEGLVDAALGFAYGRLPELFSGHPRREEDRSPIQYPAACSPQAWAAGAVPLALTSLLGLRANALSGQLEIRRPRLPRCLPRIELKGLRVGNARVDLYLTRNDGCGHARVEWQVRTGVLDVLHTEDLAPPDRPALEPSPRECRND
jgi:glycogen debranching enzyme